MPMLLYMCSSIGRKVRGRAADSGRSHRCSIETGGAKDLLRDPGNLLPGSLLFDYGDSLRFGASTAVEDEADLSKVNFDLEYFESYTRGFLSELGSKITEAEVKLLPLSALILTFECGIRFLTDYLNGDTYFKIHYANQNIIRAKNQLKLVQDINSKLDEMTKIVAKYA